MKKIIPITLLGSIVVICFGLLLINMWKAGYEDSKHICNNLLNEGLIKTNAECVIARDPKVFLPAMFPIYQTNIDYVKQGMQGFKILDEYNASRCSKEEKFTVILYQLVPAYSVYFDFCNGILISISYSD